MQRVPIDLADRAIVASNLRLQAIGERGLREPLQDFLAVPIVTGLIVEDQHQAGQPEQRRGAQMLQMRNPVHHDLDWNGYLLFHFLGGPAGPLGDDLNVVIGYIRISFDRQIVKRNGAPDQQQQGCGEHQKASIEGVVDERPNHSGPKLFSIIRGSGWPGRLGRDFSRDAYFTITVTAGSWDSSFSAAGLSLEGFAQRERHWQVCRSYSHGGASR